MLIGGSFLSHWLFEAVKLYFYAVHLTPIGMALFAIAIRRACHGAASLRAAASLVAGLLILVHLAGTAFTIRRASYRTTFPPLVEYLRTHTRPDDLVMGSAELAFGLGFDANLIDDVRLGHHSGKRPDFIVLDARYKETQTTHLPEEHPQAAHHVASMLPAYERVFSIGDYDVLAVGKRGTGTLRGQAP